MPDEIIVRAFIGSDGGIMFDIYLDPEGVELPDDSDDGGECTAPLHADDCGINVGDEGGDECGEACEKRAAAPVLPSDWKAALEMATEQAVALIERADKDANAAPYTCTKCGKPAAHADDAGKCAICA